MTGIGVLTVNEAERIGLAADMAASLTLEALKGITSAFDPALLAVRPHPELELVGDVFVSGLMVVNVSQSKAKFACRMLTRYAVFRKYTVLLGSPFSTRRIVFKLK